MSRKNLGPRKKFSVRLPLDLYQKARRAVFEKETSFQAVSQNAIENFVQKYEKGKIEG